MLRKIKFPNGNFILVNIDKLECVSFGHSANSAYVYFQFTHDSRKFSIADVEVKDVQKLIELQLEGFIA